MPAKILSDYLRLFYGNLKKLDGTFFAPSSLICIRASIHRHLTSVEINSDYDIVNGIQFRRANGVLKAMIGKYLASDTSKQKEYQEISPSDMQKLKEYFDRSDANRLQEEVIFHCLYCFALRGRETLRQMTKDTIGYSKDDKGREYLCIQRNMISKNVKASLSAKEFNDAKHARIYKPLNANEVSSSPYCAIEQYLRCCLKEQKIIVYFQNR